MRDWATNQTTGKGCIYIGLDKPMGMPSKNQGSMICIWFADSDSRMQSQSAEPPTKYIHTWNLRNTYHKG